MKIRPSKAWIWIGAVLMAIGAIAGIAIAGIGAKQMSDDIDTKFARFVAPGSADISISKAGDYVIYYEFRSDVDGTRYETSETPPNFTATVRAPDGRSLELRPYTHDITFSVNDRAGIAREKFRADAAGRYNVAINATGATAPFVVAVGAPVVPRLWRLIAVAALVGGLCFVTGLVVLIVTIVKRRKARRRPLPPGPVIASGWPVSPPASPWAAPVAGTAAPLPAPTPGPWDTSAPGGAPTSPPPGGTQPPPPPPPSVG
ncbi:MAG: hypothetical protein AB7L13_17340 [Acidimicrobiia bacterium]